jgi:hypothetical protein
MAPFRVYNIRTSTHGEFDLHATVMLVFEFDGELDETDVHDFEGDHAIDEAIKYVKSQGGTVGEIT